MDVVLDRIARLPNTSGVLLLSKKWLPIGCRGALAESDAEAIEGILAPWTSVGEDDIEEAAEDNLGLPQPHECATTQRETLPSSGKVQWGDNGGHIHFYRASTHTLVLLKHPPKPAASTAPLSLFSPSSSQTGNLTMQARLLGLRRSSGQSMPTVATRRSLFSSALEVPSVVDHAAGATVGLGPAGALSAPGSSSSLKTVRAVTSSSWSLRTSRFVPRSYSSR